MSLDVYLTCTVDTGGDEPHVVTLYDANITHNLNKMAGEAGIYKHLWRPEELDIHTAGELIEPLSRGLQEMRDDPARFEAFSPPNGWGTYEDFVPWVQKYLDACKEHPKANIGTCR